MIRLEILIRQSVWTIRWHRTHRRDRGRLCRQRNRRSLWYRRRYHGWLKRLLPVSRHPLNLIDTLRCRRRHGRRSRRRRRRQRGFRYRLLSRWCRLRRHLRSCRPGTDHDPTHQRQPSLLQAHLGPVPSPQPIAPVEQRAPAQHGVSVNRWHRLLARLVGAAKRALHAQSYCADPPLRADPFLDQLRRHHRHRIRPIATHSITATPPSVRARPIDSCATR